MSTDEHRLAEGNRSTRALKQVCLVLIALGLLASGRLLVSRVNVERSSRNVEVVLDYSEVLGLASARGLSVDAMLHQLRESGATAVAIPEESLDSLEAAGELQTGPRPMLTGLQPPPPQNWANDGQVFTVQCASQATYDFVFKGLARSYPAEDVKPCGELGLVIHGDRSVARDRGLGLWPAKVATVFGAGLHIVPRLHGADWEDAAQIDAALDAAAQSLPATPSGKADSTIIFDGKALPGYPNALDRVAADLKRHGFLYGSVEFGKQKGDDELGAMMPDQMLRVHSISADELSGMTPVQAEQRFALAVKDRNIRVLYVRFPQASSVDPAKSACDYVAGVAEAVRHVGYVVNREASPRPFPYFTASKYLLALLFLAGGAAALLALVNILPEQLPPSWATGLSVVFLLGAVVALGSAGLSATGTIGREVFGLFAAIGFPLLALIWSYRLMDKWSPAKSTNDGQTDGQTRVSVLPGPSQAIVRAIGTIILATAITLAGGLLVAALMADTRYLVKVRVFLGPRYAIIIPVLVMASLVVADGVARRGEDLAAYWERFRRRTASFFTQPLSLLWVVVGAVTLALLVIVVARAGNDSGVAVSSTELHFRSALEQVLLARPRTKEFLFGHPLLLLGYYLGARGYRMAAMLLLLAGAIGQTDVLNTFCHGHTPVLVSLWRVGNGLWLGILIGLVLIGIVHLFLKSKVQSPK